MLYGVINSDYNRTLFVEYPNWGTAPNNNGNLMGESVGAATTPQALGSLPYFNASFTYDKANRLTAASESGSGTWSRNFGYDQWGNMAVTGNSGVPFNGLTPYGSGQYNTKNQLVSGLVVYDASGNTTSVSTMRMGYTAENQFWIAYDVNSGMTVEYLPDGFGNRVWKQVTGGATTYYLYDALGQLAAEYTGPTALTKEYIRMGGQLVAIQNASGTPCSTCYLTYDHLGSVRLVTDQSANIVSRHDFLPFGEEIPAGYAGRWSQFGASDKINQRFTGQDRETENVVPVDYFNARNFTGVLGRFNSPDPGNIGADPANPESWNGYAYVGNAPLTNVDPDGTSFAVFDAATQVLTIYPDLSDPFAALAGFCAANNVDSKTTIGKLADGTYSFLPSDSTQPHPHSGAAATPNGAFGPGGIFRLQAFVGEDGKSHIGVGIHAGRANSGGYRHPTYGCVRTTESAISYISWLAKFDPLTTLTVINNRPRVNTQSGPQAGAASSTIFSSSSTIRYGSPGGTAGSGWGPFGWNGFDLLNFLSGSFGGGDGLTPDVHSTIGYGPPSQ